MFFTNKNKSIQERLWDFYNFNADYINGLKTSGLHLKQLIAVWVIEKRSYILKIYLNE